MLEIKKLTKIYKTGTFQQKALNNVSVNFRESEFASILGPSGSGKTTFLNIIGGLDKYTSGDLIINEVSTKKFKDRDWDSYRNHRIGFVFQSYNLITHQTILSNVALALTLSGITKDEGINRAKKALEEVGLKEHIYKKPTELSGGQMQRVAIARALVNNPDILLADEPTGALDSETSIQIMEILKKISKTKLVIMVTHNPELAKKYSNRIITLKDGEITSDSNPYDGKVNTKNKEKINVIKNEKTTMKFRTALSLSFNNLMTKKGRTLLVSLAGSIGIIGIALILALSTGFQNYVDSIGEEALTSYPLTVYEESGDLTSMFLSLSTDNIEKRNDNKVVEQQVVSKMLGSISTNDLKSFKYYLEDNYKKVESDLSYIQYGYSIEPNIYTIDVTNKLSKVNPSNLFSSVYGTNNMFSSYSKMASIFSPYIDNEKLLNENYEILKGRWPKNYDEVIIVLADKNAISDLLVYNLGLRDVSELSNMITKIMSGEKVNITSKPKEFSYDDLLNVDLRVIKATDLYKYNNTYDIYEDMSNDNNYMDNLYKNAIKLKVVGIVTNKEDTNGRILSQGVNYREELIEHLIDDAKNSNIVKKQLKNSKIDVFSGNNFDNNKQKFNFSFSDIISIDKNKMSEAFNININEKKIEKDTQNYINKINESIKVDYSSAKNKMDEVLTNLSKELLNSISTISDVDNIVSNFLNNKDIFNELEKEYVIPAQTFKDTYSGLLKGLLTSYSSSIGNTINPTMNDTFINGFKTSAPIMGTIDTFSKLMMEAKVKKDVLTNVSELSTYLTKSFANTFKVDEKKIASAFKLNLNEDEIKRVVSAMLNNNETTQKSNLITLGYQDIDDPTYISFYFNSFDGKEDFLSFIEKYNSSVDEEQKLKYSDTAGILTSSIKTIVNAVSYVLIAFVSISLVVSSIMIGVITYISVYERTKEIGILRAIGASKRNISSIFNAETFIIGLLSGALGIIITYILIPIINAIIHHYTGNVPINATLNITAALVLIIISIILTLIGGIIPSKAASKKDPVEALRTE